MKACIMPGAVCRGHDGTRFAVWAPFRERVDVHIVAPRERMVVLKKDGCGYFSALAEDVAAGNRYFYRLDGSSEYPDPASRFQPEGIHGPSEVVDTGYDWEDRGWRGIPLDEYILYELHTGTFTAEGTFAAVIGEIDRLRKLGVTALELMPVAQFPGTRNWGYDGAYPYAPQDSYGGPVGLKRLVDACHRHGLAVVLDVVYNHLGPEGNHLARFGPYFTDRYQTPWGAALNFDGACSDEVRRFFIENALYWFREFHIDALRLDALHAILDISAYTFIEELAESVREEAKRLKRRIYLIGESAANNARLVRPREQGGYGLDAQWNDDFHHALHTLLTGEKTGYYEDFGKPEHLVKAWREGFVYSGQYSPYHQRRHGTSSRDIPPSHFVVFSQNHDQVGNRALGDRLSSLVSFEALKLAAGAVLLSPFIPLLFMGEEYAETAPFPYFVSHTDPGLVDAVRRGRRREFAAFAWQGEIPDPQSETTYFSAKLDRSLCDKQQHRLLNDFYRELIRLRREVPALNCSGGENLEVAGDEQNAVVLVHRWQKNDEVVILYHLEDKDGAAALQLPEGRWRKLLDSADAGWGGEGGTAAAVIAGGACTVQLPRQSFVLLRREG